MTEIINMIGSYGYGAMLGGVAAYHLFPDFVGGQNEEARQQGLEDTKKLLTLIMEIRGDSPWIAGDQPSIADYLLGPLMFYLSLTPDKGEVLGEAGLQDWWDRLSADEHFAQTEPDLG